MALSAKQRKRNQLARQQEELSRLEDSTYEYLKAPFFEHLENDPNWSSVALSFDLMGIEQPEFSDDRGPRHHALDEALGDDPDEAFPGFAGSIGRAEVMVDLLLDAATELSGIINSYKMRELEKRRAELEKRDLTEERARKDALETSARIAKLQEELQKNVRRTFRQWKIKGV